jgi:hypothetical protein
MNYPELKVQKAKLNEEVDIIRCFLKTSWAKYLYQMYPDLKETTDLKETLEKIYLEQEEKINKKIEIIKKEWNKKGNKFMKIVSEIIGTEWLDKEIGCFVSISEMGPRFLDDNDFFVFYNYDLDKTMRHVCHEIIHFIYFKKFKELFPNVDKCKYESPYPEWLLSEVIDPILLNDSRLKDFVKNKQKGYREFDNIYVEKEKIMDYFSTMYDDYKNQGNSFEKFLKDAYKVIKKDYDNYFLKI